MRKLLVGFLTLASLSSFAQVSDAELECMEQFEEISFTCTYRTKQYPSVVAGRAKHVSKRVAKNLAKEICETESNVECRYSSCTEQFGLYSKTHVSGGSQTMTIGGNPDYSKQRREDKRELKKLRIKAMESCSEN